MNKLCAFKTRPCKKDLKKKKAVRAWYFGLLAEWASIVYLKMKGWKILYHRYKSPLGEIDIMALKGNTIVAVEVKFRSHLSEEDSLVTQRQWKRISRTAGLLLRQFPPDFTLRFDLVVWTPWKFPQHLENMWWEEGL